MIKYKYFNYQRNKIETNQRKNEIKIENLAKNVVKTLKRKNLIIATMESCTGGGLANEITNVIGASEVFKGGFIAYSNQEKIARGVSEELIKKFSVYSPQVALAMAKRAIKEIKGADVGVGITGTFSRVDPENPNSNVGQVFAAVVFKKKGIVANFIFPNLKNRKAMKSMAILKVLELIKEVIN
jgi:PncC family amidohydrolase